MVSIELERTALINVDLQRCFVEGAPDGLAIVRHLDAGVLRHHRA